MYIESETGNAGSDRRDVAKQLPERELIGFAG
jgi:hypothetical protein